MTISIGVAVFAFGIFALTVENFILALAAFALALYLVA